MREIRLSGSEGGGTGFSLPLSGVDFHTREYLKQLLGAKRSGRTCGFPSGFF
jgi:hypothetical protein